MPVNESYREYVMERLECVGQVTARNMFGGVGIYICNSSRLSLPQP